MPALDRQTLQDLRTRLETRQDVIGREVQAVSSEQDETESKLPRNQVEDDGEHGEQALREAVRHAERERDILELREIGTALERMEAGDYGSCVDCGADIPVARLQAQPWAARCIACQEKYEQRNPPEPRIRPTL